MKKRLTTEEPQGNVGYMLNMTKIIDKEVYIRDWNGEGDISLVAFCNRECKEKCNIDNDAPADEFGEAMDCDCFVSYFYILAVGHAEIRSRLKYHEDLMEEGAET
jgi:hypothetical protein